MIYDKMPKFHCHLHETHTRNGDYDQITLEVSTANQRNNICPSEPYHYW